MNSEENQAFVSKGLDLLAHRGQDQKSIISINKNFKIGHRRLTITGNDQGIQPLNEGLVWAMSNGEFYDYETIAQKEKIHPLDSDASILIPLYKKYGIKQMLTHLTGEFVFIIVDESINKIFLVRDLMGNKPLYYSATKGFQVASEIKAFKSTHSLCFNQEVLMQKLQMQYHQPDTTLFTGIDQVAPGWVVEYDYRTKEIKKWQYDNLYLSKDQKPLDLDQVYQLLHQSVARRIKGQNPALTLSGGLDSSIILHIAQSINPQLKDAFSISFKGGGIYDEKELVLILKEKYNLNLHLIEISLSDQLSVLEEALYHAEDVTINLHLAAKFLLFQKIKSQGFKVSLSGEGSDEFFMGYKHFYPTSENIHYLSGMHLPDSYQLDNGEELPTFLKAKLSIGYKISQFLTKPHIPNFKLLSPHIVTLHPLHQASYLWSKLALSNSILIALGDKMEMASTIEGRTPFLDKELINYISQIPPEHKISHTEDKTILRKIFKTLLPIEIIEKPKHPFLSPPVIGTPEGVEFIKTHLLSWNNELLNRQAIEKFLNNIHKLSEQEQRVYDPVFMILTSLAILQKRLCDT